MWRRAACRAAVSMVLLAVFAAPAFGTELAAGAGVLEVAVAAPHGEHGMRVHYFKPARAGVETPILFIMHGAGRNADGYRDVWIGPAEEHGWLIVAPEFTKREYPGTHAYNLGNVFTKDRRRNPPAQWGFAAIERIFAEIVGRTGSRCRTFGIYGHSAGAQFVHRMMLFRPDAPIGVAVAANAGWYTLPDIGVEWPYGMGSIEGAGSTHADAFAKKLIVLLGSADTDTAGRYLNRSEGAMAQGPHRFARGAYFFAQAQAVAAEQGATFAWEKVEVPGVGHSNRRMAPAAAVQVARFLRCG